MIIQDCDECDWSKFHELKQELHRLTAENDRLKKELEISDWSVELLEKAKHKTAARCAELILKAAESEDPYCCLHTAEAAADAIRKEFGL